MITRPEPGTPRRVKQRDTLPGDHALRSRLAHCLAAGASAGPAVLVRLDVAGAWDVKDASGCAAVKELRETVAATLAGTLEDGVPVACSGLCGFTLLLEGRHPDEALAQVRDLKRAVDALCFYWHGRPFRLWAHAGVLELGPDQAPARHWLARAREACTAARELAGDGIQLVEYNDHAWNDMTHNREWVRHLSEIIG